MVKRNLTLAILFLSLVFSGCKKDNKTVINPMPWITQQLETITTKKLNKI